MLKEKKVTLNRDAAEESPRCPLCGRLGCCGGAAESQEEKDAMREEIAYLAERVRKFENALQGISEGVWVGTVREYAAGVLEQ